MKADTRAQTSPVAPRSSLAGLSAVQRNAYITAMSIKARYADGQPLDEDDKRFLLSLLKHHPKGRAKFGCGIRDVIPGRYIGGDRCFFVVRTDGSVEDFSVRRCLGLPTGQRSPRIQAAMRAFRYATLLLAYRRHTARTVRRAGGRGE